MRTKPTPKPAQSSKAGASPPQGSRAPAHHWEAAALFAFVLLACITSFWAGLTLGAERECEKMVWPAPVERALQDHCLTAETPPLDSPALELWLERWCSE